ncbi:EVE domain protein [Synechococcus sp. BOUM118]|nr:EVE domain protein [Synechococcus sp. BOUM118]
MAFWLMKSEPEAYGIDDLRREGNTLWDGIRNYQARNFMRSMAIGDQAFFYHSNCKPPGIIGLMEVEEIGLVDPTQFDPDAKYYDPKSNRDKPRWDCARLRFLGEFQQLLSLDQLREQYSEEQLPVIKRGNRLSILPVPDATAADLLERLGPLH